MKNFSLSREQQLLCDAVAAAENPATGPTALRKFLADLTSVDAWNFARRNQVETILGHFGETIEGDGRWVEGHRRIAERVGGYLAELDRLAAVFAERGIVLVALKNTGIARGIRLCPGCCPMGDVDLLVARDRFREAHGMLLEQGYVFEFRSPLETVDPAAAERTGGAEYWKELKGEKFWLELQWRPVAGRWLRPDQEPTATDLIFRSAAIPGTAVRMLAPEDNLLQVCLHTAKHSFVRDPGFRLHLDVHRILRNQEIDWSRFVCLVESLKVRTPTFFSLLLPAELLGSPVPDHVLSRLRPNRWRKKALVALLQRAGLFDPGERKFGRIGYVLFNALLYDDLRGLLRGMFPPADWMKERYGFTGDLALPYFYGRRLWGLLFRRLRT